LKIKIKKLEHRNTEEEEEKRPN